MARILLAEDGDDVRRFVANALRRAGHDVTPCDDGRAAWSALQAREYDLLLADIVMPRMDGIELARRAAALHPEMKIMFITGFAAVAVNPENRAPENAKILSKPFHLKELVNEVERLAAA